MGFCKKVGVKQALKYFGGFVQYYDSTVNRHLPQFASWVSERDCRNILACCGSGDPALTMLGAGGEKEALWAVDINSAQLFVLAAKACFLKKNNRMPTFQQIERLYPGKIAAIKRTVRRLQDADLIHMLSGKKIVLPVGLGESSGVVINKEMWVAGESGPYWKNDPLFVSRVCARLGRLQFLWMDIFDSSDYFKPGSLDLIYMSNIFLLEGLAYYQVKLEKMIGLLRSGGRMICHVEKDMAPDGFVFSPGRLLAEKASRLDLKVNSDQASEYVVLERIGKAK